MPTAPPTAAPPNFYDNLPAGGDAAAGGPSKKKTDGDEELMKAVTKIYGIIGKIGKAKEGIEPLIDGVKTALKKLAIEGLKMDPKDLDTGDETPAASETAPPATPAGGAGAPPTSTDESHAA
jgi:hypothetical protein